MANTSNTHLFKNVRHPGLNLVAPNWEIMYWAGILSDLCGQFTEPKFKAWLKRNYHKCWRGERYETLLKMARRRGYVAYEKSTWLAGG